MKQDYKREFERQNAYDLAIGNTAHSYHFRRGYREGYSARNDADYKKILDFYRELPDNVQAITGVEERVAGLGKGRQDKLDLEKRLQQKRLVEKLFAEASKK